MNLRLAQGDAHQAVLHSLHKQGPATYLDLELRLARPGLHRVVNYLQQGRFIRGQTKKAGRLRVYEITDDGLNAIGLFKPQGPTPLSLRPAYVPPSATVARAGALDAFAIPSRGMREAACQK